MELSDKIVDFTFCTSCKHWSKEEKEDPCYECLLVPARKDSHVPLYFESETDKKKIESNKHEADMRRRGWSV